MLCSGLCAHIFAGYASHLSYSLASNSSGSSDSSCHSQEPSWLLSTFSSVKPLLLISVSKSSSKSMSSGSKTWKDQARTHSPQSGSFETFVLDPKCCATASSKSCWTPRRAQAHTTVGTAMCRSEVLVMLGSISFKRLAASSTKPLLKLHPVLGWRDMKPHWEVGDTLW